MPTKKSGAKAKVMKPVDLSSDPHNLQHEVVKSVEQNKKVKESDVFVKKENYPKKNSGKKTI